MFVSWGLKTLLAALAVAVQASPLPPPGEADTAPGLAPPPIDLDRFNATAQSSFVERVQPRRVLPPQTPAKILEIDPSWRLSPIYDKPPTGLLELRDDAQCSPSSPIVCAAANGSGPVCAGCSTCCPDGAGGFLCCAPGFKCCVAANGAGSCCPNNGGTCQNGVCVIQPTTVPGISTVFATTTITHISTVSGVPKTTAVVFTVTETITVENPSLQTETDTVTATSIPRKVRRARTDRWTAYGSPSIPARVEVPTPRVTIYHISASDDFEPRVVHLGAKVVRQEVGAAVVTTTTSTVTIDVTSTITVAPTFTSTVFNTVFVTVTVAPNAVATVFTTVTIFTTPGVGPPATPPGQAPPTVSGSPTVPATPTTIPPTPQPAPTTTASTPSVSGPVGSSSRGTATRPGGTATGPSSPTLGSRSNTLTSAPSSTAISNPNSLTMMTTPVMTVTPTPPPPPLPLDSSDSGLNSNEIAGIVLGAIAFIVFLAVIALLIRKCVRRRRSQLAERRQQVTPPSGQLGSGSVAGSFATSGGRTTGSGSPPAGGPGEVRVVIQPPPRSAARGARGLKASRMWPMPPGHRGPTYSAFMDDTTGENTPQDQGQWSVASEFGGSVSPEGGYSTSGPGTRRASGVPSSGVLGPEGNNGGGGNNSNNGYNNSGYNSSGPQFSRQQQAADWQSTEGGRSDGPPSMGSSSAPRTRLQPPPPIYGYSMREGYGSGSSTGVGRAL